MTDVTGYIAVDRTRNLTVLAFRGSSSIRNWLANVDFIPVPTDICPGCTAHQGFWDSWQEARSGVLNSLVKTAKQYPSSQVVVVGHSLGGAIADFAAAEIRNQGIHVDLYTYGAPRIAGKTLSDFITNQNRGGNFRSTHTNDPVPRLPPSSLGFVHLGQEYWITTPNNVVPTANDIQRLDGSFNRGGNTGQATVNVDAHLYYFGPISSCTPNNGFELLRREAESAEPETVKHARAESVTAKSAQPCKNPAPVSSASVMVRCVAVTDSF